MRVSVAPLNKISVVFARIYTIDDMKYLKTIDLLAGEETDVSTTLTTVPYSVQLLDSAGNDVSGCFVRTELTGGVYHLIFYSTDALSSCNLYIIY